MDLQSPPQSICMLCGTTAKFGFVHKLRDDETRNVYQCDTCGHIQILPLPLREDDELRYQRNEQYKQIHSLVSEFQNEEKLMSKYCAFVKNSLKYFINYVNKNQKILDIGTGYGWAVELLREDGYEIDGAEISDLKRQMLKQRSGIELFDWNLLDGVPNVIKACYDVISMFHVLEHISEPIIFLKRAAALLKTTGAIYIEVPNHDDYMKTALPEYNAFSYTRQHLSYFTHKTLFSLLVSAGFKEIKFFGLQNYSFENSLWWMREKRPFLDYHQINVPKPLQWLNKIYKERVESELKSCYIVCIGYKRNEDSTSEVC